MFQKKAAGVLFKGLETKPWSGIFWQLHGVVFFIKFSFEASTYLESVVQVGPKGSTLGF